jgi:hypothetical protein
MVCGAEMILIKVVPDDTMMVPGFERRSFMCSTCHDVEQHLAFVRPGRESDTEPMPVPSAPPVLSGQRDDEPIPSADTAASAAPASAAQDERTVAPPGLLKRVVARMRGRTSPVWQ